MSLLYRSHLSAHEIASLALDGLPESKRGVQLAAERDGWPFITRHGRGGGRLYAVADLPADAQADFLDRWANLPTSRRNPGGRPAGTDFFSRNPAIADAVEVLIAEKERAATEVYELLSTRFDVLPSLRSIQRFINRLEEQYPAQIASVRDPDRYKSGCRLALGTAANAVTHANQVWEIDTTRADVHVLEGRKSVLGIVDVYSRRPFYLIVDSESALSVRRTLTACMLAWGVMPEVLRTDQGSGYVNETIKTACQLLGIEHDPVPPASGDKKPFVERMFGTLTRKRFRMLPGFGGHDVAEAAKLRAVARKNGGKALILPEYTAAQLQEIITNWVDGVWNQTVHSETGATPIARFLASPVASRAVPDEAALRLALSASIGRATVTKRGVRWNKGRYWSPVLAAWMGREVMLRRDEAELGEVFVFSPAGEYLCTAVDHARSGLSQQAFASEARRMQAAHDAEYRAELRRKKREFSPEEARDALLRRDAEAAGKLHVLPPRTEAFTTPALDSILAASAPDAAAVDAVIEAAQQRAAERRLAERFPARKVLSFEQRMAETDDILARHAAGHSVDPDGLRAARIFTHDAEYRAAKILSGDFKAGRRPHPHDFSLDKKENSL